MIPKIIHQIWIQGRENLPEKYVEFSKIWKETHPDFEYKLWDENTLINLINERYPEFINNYKTANKNNKSNIGRYLIMHQYGGIYADVDSYPLKSIEYFFKFKNQYDVQITKRKDSGHMMYNAAISISKSNVNFWYDIMKFCTKRTDYNNLPIEPYGIISLEKFIENYGNNYKLIAHNPIHFNQKVDVDLPEQYVVHVYDCNWKNSKLIN